MSTNIQWTDETWLMWPGCVPASTGCAHCYARNDAWRLSFNPNPKVSAPYAGIVKKVLTDGTEILGGEDHPRRREPGAIKFTGLTRFLPERLAEPLRWRKPRRIFVSANSDLFLPARVDSETGRRQIAAVFGVMAATPRHTYQVLTKHPDMAREWFDDIERESRSKQVPQEGLAIDWARIFVRKAGGDERSRETLRSARTRLRWHGQDWPLPNVWIGTSIEDQAAADRRIPDLLRVPSARRFLSCEPLLGPVFLGGSNSWVIDWVIAGGESGPNARLCEVAWIRSIVDQCKAARVPCFTKQLGAKPLARSEDDLGYEAHAAWDSDHAGEPFPLEGWIPRLRSRSGSDPDEWPDDLRVREMPP